ncbi:ABC transporter ATP-binding protein [Streptomyces sp. 6N223]|uniref:ABC transporter ATP-binding protein n=1 Tax=Streptomyces sp. 6N223 TaxID=3457412 RepID=UPI003FD61ED5
MAPAENRADNRAGGSPPPDAPPDNDVLWARGLHYAHEGSPALLGASVGVRQGEILTVTGPRGCGKTTLLGCLSGQLLPQRGEVWFNSVPVHTLTAESRERLRREKFGWVGDSPRLVPELAVWENAALPLLLAGAGHRAAKQAALEWLERLDVGECARQRPAVLVQAQRQRVAIARALVHSPEVLFADEPTAPLHQADRAQVLRTLTTAGRSHGITVVLATHDAEVATLADRTLTIVDGRTTGAPAAATCSLSA